MTAASRSLATALWGARFASGLLPLSYTTRRDTTPKRAKATGQIVRYLNQTYRLLPTFFCSFPS